MLEGRHVVSIQYLKRNSYDVIEIENNITLNCEVSYMHNLLEWSVHWGYGCFRIDIWSLLQATYSFSERCIDKKSIFIWYNFQACSIAGYRDITPESEL